MSTAMKTSPARCERAVDLARHQLLPGTVLAEDEDAGVGFGHLGDGAENLLQDRGLADDLGERPVEVR